MQTEQTKNEAPKTESQAKAETKAFYLRASIRHPQRTYRLGPHKIGQFFNKFDLTPAEIAELNTEGPKKWIEVGTKAEYDVDKKNEKKSKKHFDDGVI